MHVNMRYHPLLSWFEKAVEKVKIVKDCDMNW